MNAGQRLCANEPDIASKIMDGEAILINLQTGAYYSLPAVGALVWQELTAHRTPGEILEALTRRYPGEARQLESDLAELLGELERENLVRPSDRETAAEAAELPGFAAPADYQKPLLEKFSDMEELLALDPPTPGALDNLMRQPLGGSDD